MPKKKTVKRSRSKGDRAALAKLVLANMVQRANESGRVVGAALPLGQFIDENELDRSSVFEMLRELYGMGAPIRMDRNSKRDRGWKWVGGENVREASRWAGKLNA